MSGCQRSFDESLLSGYLDRDLIQLDEQRVRVHLEDCADCRLLLAELSVIRQAARSTRFRPPADDQWRELPRDPRALWLRRLGWALLLAWAVATAAFLAANTWTALPWWPRLLVFAGVGAFALLLAAVAVDRAKVAPTDRYREVEK